MILLLNLFLLCTGTLLFGCLTYISSTTLFLSAAYFLRILDGINGAALYNAMLSMLLSHYHDRAAGVYALADATFYVGYMAGPVLGSFLYQAGGFFLPFLFCSAVMALIGGATMCAIHPWIKSYEKKNVQKQPSFSISKFLNTEGIICLLYTSPSPRDS